jgi:uncharacterized repeat protein (TIGR01451 family)
LLNDQSVQIKIVVTNIDPTRAPARRVVLEDVIPAGKAYVRGSGTVNGARATLRCLSPIKIELGPLRYDEKRTVVYSIKSQPAGA